MAKSATDLMHEIIFAAVMDSLGALKAASKGMPNALLRDLNAIHANATFADLPGEVQAAIGASVRAAFNRLLREGYSVTHGSAPPPRTPPRAPSPGRPPPSGQRCGPGPARPDRNGPGRADRGGPRKPGPGRGRGR